MLTNLRVRWLLVVIGSIGCFACSPPPPDPLPEEVATLSVCEAGKKSSGTRIRVSGNFEGFGYDTNSKIVSLGSNDLCNEKGAGLVFATLSNDAERKKLFTTRPGTQVLVEGTVDQVKEGRFIYLSRVIVIGGS